MDAPLFKQPRSTLAAAQQASAKCSGAWRQRILERLSIAPSTIFELAEFFEVTDNRISGRISDLARDLYIETTGERRINPKTSCPAEVWQIRRAQAGSPDPIEQLLDRTYPITIRIESDLFDRQEFLPSESYGGVPYARRADAGGQRHVIRIAIVECDKCGAPLAFAENTEPKKFRCTRATCSATWRVRTINEAGKAPTLALVAEEF
jgi:hypothetical protein